MVVIAMSAENPRITSEDLVRALMTLAVEVPKTFCNIWTRVFLIPAKKPRPGLQGAVGDSDELDQARMLRDLHEMISQARAHAAWMAAMNQPFVTRS
jgi:hypothetical protein